MGHVILTIKGKKKLPPEPKKGPILPVYEAEYLPRRGGNIQFYDMGQTLVEESWVTNNYEVVNALVQAGSVVGLSAPLTLANVQVLESDLLAPDTSQFTSLYRKILLSRRASFLISLQGVDSTANFFTYQMLSPSEGWNSGGNRLVLTTAQLNGPQLSVKDGGLQPNGWGGNGPSNSQCYPLELHDRTKSKVTLTPDFSAASTSFQLTNNAQIFLVPVLLLNHGDSQLETPPFPTPTEQVDHVSLNFIYRLRPRTEELDVPWQQGPNPFLTIAENQALFDEALARTLAAGISRTATVTTFINGDPSIFMGGGTFPIAPIAPDPTGDPDVPAGLLPAVNWMCPSIFIGQLTGVVKQGGQVYYFWYLTGDWQDYYF